MTNPKRTILLLLLFIVVGIAAVSTNVLINGSTMLAGNPDDFNVYFSRVEEISGYSDIKVDIINERHFAFNVSFDDLYDSFALDMYVTNASTNYDADVDFSCTTTNNEYLSLTYSMNEFVPARETAYGTLDIWMAKSYVGEEELEFEVTCSITANAVERTSHGSGEVDLPVDPIYIGREVAIGEEKFNIISSDETTVTMLARYNINVSSPYKQIDEQRWTMFSDSAGWEYAPGPNEVNVQEFGGDTKTLLNNYVSYIESEYSLDVTSNLITLGELRNLGCTIPEDYALGSGGWTCTGLEHSSWLVNGQDCWTRSASSEHSDYLWIIVNDGNLRISSSNYGVRPTITVSREVVKQLINVYPVGREVSFGDERFNVISDNGTSVTLLAQYNIGTDYKQSTTNNYVKFAESSGWEYTPGPKEIDIWTYSPNASTYIQNYINYLQENLGVTVISGDLITLQHLKKLGCTFLDNYSAGASGGTCADSKYVEWLITEQGWWTRSATSDSATFVWKVNSSSVIRPGGISGTSAIRPIITVPKSALS